MKVLEQDDKRDLMSIASAVPLDRYHTRCSQCGEVVAYLHGYKVDEQWYCAKCYRYDEPEQGRYGSKRNDRAS